MNKIKIFIISFCFILSTLFIDITPTFAMEYAGYSFTITISVWRDQYNNPDFILNSMDGYSLELYKYSDDTSYIYEFNQMNMSGTTGNYLFKTRDSNAKLDINGDGVSQIFKYDIYLLNLEGERIYHLHVSDATTSTFSFGLFSPYSPPSDDIGGNTTVNFDDTNIVNNLVDISKRLDTFISIFLFYFGYKIIKEINNKFERME